MAERDPTRTPRSKLAAAPIAVCAHDAGRPAHRERAAGSRDDAGHFPDRWIIVLVESIESGISGQADVPDRRGRVVGHSGNVGFDLGNAAALPIRSDE
jgi:hypothetical protein